MPTVFGLDLWSEGRLSFLATATAEPTGRTLEVSLLGAAEELGWPATAELISDQRQPDGSVNFQIEAAPSRGFRFWGPVYGTSIVSTDGRQVLGAEGSGGVAAWQRLLVAQVLPFAAVLQGLEVLHASAIAVGGKAVALAGPSGSGKTSLALELCRRGAELLTDDVIALERVCEALIVHPGAPVAGVDLAEADRLDRAGVGRTEVLAVNSRERLARVQLSRSPAPLRALFFIDRRPDAPAAVRFEEAADAQALISSTFNLVLTGRQRLERLLDTSALLAACRVERAVCGSEVGVEALGAAIARRIGELA